MRDIALVTDDDLARARVDPAFQASVVADNLERLLEQLNRLRKPARPTPQRATQIREGVDLAVQLAELLQRMSKADHGAEPTSSRGPRRRPCLTRLKRLRFRRRPL